MFVVFSSNVYAGLVSYSKQQITSIRAEGNVALLDFNIAPDSSSGCEDRVWIALDNEVSRAKYSLALTAFMSGKEVSVRAYDTESLKIFTECKMYDIVVSK